MFYSFSGGSGLWINRNSIPPLPHEFLNFNYTQRSGERLKLLIYAFRFYANILQFFILPSFPSLPFITIQFKFLFFELIAFIAARLKSHDKTKKKVKWGSWKVSWKRAGFLFKLQIAIEFFFQVVAITNFLNFPFAIFIY